MNPFKRRNEQPGQAVVLDTSGLIDGRIVQIARAGFVPQTIIVPQFVVAEMQFLADHGDSHKRERARYGMDVVRELQELPRIDVEIAREKFEDIKEVDDKLVALAKQYGAFLYTTDFNLNKVAQIEGVAVLNVNELAHALRPNLLPGERVSIKLTQVGQDKTQGVGYLNDGTMVVVEQAGRLVGQQVQAICTRILQTQAGKMMFATLASGHLHSQSQHQPTAQQQQKKSQPTERPDRKTQETRQQPNQPAQPTHQQPKKQRDKRSDHPKGQARDQKQQPQQHNKQAASKQQGRQRSPQNTSQKRNRRVTPEDSLLATLKEIEQ